MNLTMIAREALRSIRIDRWAPGTVMVVWSGVLATRMIFAADDAAIENFDSLVVYRQSELRKILRLGLDQGELRFLHYTKVAFPGAVVEECISTRRADHHRALQGRTA